MKSEDRWTTGSGWHGASLFHRVRIQNKLHSYIHSCNGGSSRVKIRTARQADFGRVQCSRREAFDQIDSLTWRVHRGCGVCVRRTSRRDRARWQWYWWWRCADVCDPAVHRAAGCGSLRHRHSVVDRDAYGTPCPNRCRHIRTRHRKLQPAAALQTLHRHSSLCLCQAVTARSLPE